MKHKPAPSDPVSASKLTLDADGLNSRERIFCHAYMSNGENGVRAAKTAGYAGDAGRRACLLLKQPRIKAVIERERTKTLTELDVRKEKVLRELARIAFFDPRRLFQRDGSLLPIQLWPPDAAAVISGLEFRGGALSRLRFCVKSQALELLGKFLKLWDGQAVQGDRLDEIVQALRGLAEDGKKKDTVN
jgi:phage terminase small subunit